MAYVGFIASATVIKLGRFSA
ncbi:hypothetical protein PEPE_1687 [Pediococcus pentosaceus ATCC 25745]|uniref:Uncharacterized protein n=1 Tax=Pediococcus pentosaceus (strain ATCC 25745 / CCUG 21536 / LMG 10740 / 183-1w) TaxID=278197 RepID=Q03DL4_PEDPA|nr:hypothetical protein PEPE_1687 [Pediococcus pentosaceus ATCC 25745]